MDEDIADALGSRQAQVFPGFAAVGAAIDPIAGGDAVAHPGFARTYPDRIRVLLVDGYFADSLHMVIEDRLKERAPADAFPDPTPGGTHIDDFRAAVYCIYSADAAAGRSRPDLARPKAAEQVFDRYLAGERADEGQKAQANDPFHGILYFMGYKYFSPRRKGELLCLS